MTNKLQIPPAPFDKGGDWKEASSIIAFLFPFFVFSLFCVHAAQAPVLRVRDSYIFGNLNFGD